MDTLTHALIGAAISDSGFRRRCGAVATPFALAVGALPDIDILTYFVSPESAWAYHRGYSHSFFVELLAAPVLGYVGLRLARGRGTWLSWCLLALLCLFAHTLVDLVTSWGTMPWLPFSNARVSWDIAPILDVFVVTLAAASFVTNRILRWERVDHFANPLAYPVAHRHPRRQRAADRVATVAVTLLVVYFLVGWQQNRQTVRLAGEELAKAGVSAVEVRALPIMFTYLAWDIVARDASGTVYNGVVSGYAPKPIAFTAHPTRDDAETRAALASPAGRLFAWYAQDMFVADAAARADGWLVTLRDRRFFTLTAPDDPRFTMEIRLGADGVVSSARAVQAGFRGVDVAEEIRALWNLTRYGEPFPAVPQKLAEAAANTD